MICVSGVFNSFLTLNILDIGDSIFLINIPSDKMFLLVLNRLALTFDLFFFKFTLVKILNEHVYAPKY